MSDANAVGQLRLRVLAAVFDLRDAIEEAEAGHRGLKPDWFTEVRTVLEEAGYEIRRLPGKGVW